MPNLRSPKRSRAPKTRTYKPAPRLNQKKFPARRRVTKSTPMPSGSGRLSRQETLTQIGFARMLPDSEDEEMSELSDGPGVEGRGEISEEEYQAPRTRNGNSRKRRRSVDEEDEDDQPQLKRQSTLTQIGFFVEDTFEADEATDEEAGYQSSIENYGSPAGVQIAASLHSSPYHSPRPQPQLQPTIPSNPPHFIKPEPYTQSPTHVQPQSPSPSPFLRPPTPIFKTPQKPIKREVPSSQSPPVTPLTLTRHTSMASPSPLRLASPSPLRYQVHPPPDDQMLTNHVRSPLQDIPENVLATRDSITPSEKVKKSNTHPSSSTHTSQPHSHHSNRSNHSHHSQNLSNREVPPPTLHKQHSQSSTQSTDFDGDTDMEPHYDQENQDPDIHSTSLSLSHDDENLKASNSRLLQQFSRFSQNLRNQNSPGRNGALVQMQRKSSPLAACAPSSPIAAPAPSFSQATSVTADPDVTQYSLPPPMTKDITNNNDNSMFSSQFPDPYPTFSSSSAPHFSIFSDEDVDGDAGMMDADADLGKGYEGGHGSGYLDGYLSGGMGMGEESQLVTVSQLLGRWGE